MSELLTVKKVSEKLKINRNAVYLLIKEKKLRTVKLGSIKVRASTLDKFIENLEREQNNG